MLRSTGFAILGGPAARVDATLIAGERIVISCGRDMLAWVLDHSLHVIATVSCLAIALASDQAFITVLAALATIVLGTGFASLALSAACTRYVLTSHRAIRFSGVLRSDQEYMTWGKVTDVSIERSFADRLTGTATIRIHSANENSSFKTLQDIGQPLEFAACINKLVARRQGGIDLAGFHD